MNISRSIYRPLFADPSFPLFMVLAGSFFLTVFFRISASVILPLEGERLGMSASLVGFISSVHFYAYAMMQPVSGILHDRYGPVRVVTCGLLITAASCLLLTVVRTPLSLGIWRLVSGLGVSPMYSATLVFMAFAFPAERYCFYAGINFAVSSLGAIVSVAPLGFVLDNFGLPATFAILSGTSLLMALFLGRSFKGDHVHFSEPPHEVAYDSMGRFLRVVVDLSGTLGRRMVQCGLSDLPGVGPLLELSDQRRDDAGASHGGWRDPIP